MTEAQVHDPYPIVHNKVLSPHFINPTLRRSRLLEWLDEHANCRVIVVAADAGYGKTTLLWQWEREVAFPCYWYKLDQNDRDWSLQISYLIEALRDRHDGFGTRTTSLLGQIGASSETGRATVTASLIAELNDRVVEPVTFIVDDWQFVASVPEVRAFWNQVLRDASGNCRFVFLARAKPQLQFSRFAAHAGYAELRTDALRFNEDEIRRLFGEVYQDALEEDEIAQIERRTEGWAASLQLIEVSLRERTTPDARRAFIASITATRDSQLFNFLADEVLAQQAPETRAFLLFTSILSQITPELAERMTGVQNARAILNGLEESGIFTYRLDPETSRYRYHGLFRDFLERCLKHERTDAEVAGLHIHAASYFETHAQWPDAIHHYLAAKLTTQAARLIGRYGEEVVAGGRLGLIDEWLQQLPAVMVRANARLSLLWGEALGMRGEWKQALSNLERARRFFHRKADNRLEALAYVKLSTVDLAYGDIVRGARRAIYGLRIAPDDDAITRLRLRGNLAVGRDWSRGRLESVESTCEDIATQTTGRGLDHYAAIAHYNLGILKRWREDLAGSARQFEMAWNFWQKLEHTPYGDNSEYVVTLLDQGETTLALSRAEQGLRHTVGWPRPYAQATLGRALVDIHVGDFPAAIQRLEAVTEHAGRLGVVSDEIRTALIEAHYLGGSPVNDLRATNRRFEREVRDKRQEPMTVVADAILAHAEHGCACQDAASRLSHWHEAGAVWPVLLGRLKLAILGFDHVTHDSCDRAIAVVGEFSRRGRLRSIRQWLRCLAPRAELIATRPSGLDVLSALLNADPDFWRVRLVGVLAHAPADGRALLIEALGRHGNRAVIAALQGSMGRDAQELRRSLVRKTAARIHIRTMGRMVVSRSAWSNPAIRIDRPRLRSLLGLLLAHAGTGLSRDQVLDQLWPDASPVAAANSLHQTVFQLRRAFAPEYKDGEDPPYILCTTDLVTLEAGTVLTDLEEFRRHLRRADDSPTARAWAVEVTRAIELIRGEYLADFRYDDWAFEAQPRVHAEVRQWLNPIAHGSGRFGNDDLAIRAASAMLTLDSFDEEALAALADRLAASGRHVAARQLLARFAARLAADDADVASRGLANPLELGRSRGS